MPAPRTRVQRRPVHGVLLLDKPLGWSSNQALQKAKWLLRAEKAGHTGTLDPLATGVLPLCFGAATKFSQGHLEADKTYEALLRLGQTTTTGDAEGEVLSEQPVTWTPADLQDVERRFTGALQQVPPMFSALKRDGKPLYEYARAGIDVQREPRAVHIHSLQIEPTAERTELRLTVRCSKGTYIRTLGEDIGKALGSGGHLRSLRRLATGPFQAVACITLETLEATSPDERTRLLQPVDCLLGDHEAVTLAAQDAGRYLSGLRRRVNQPDHPHVAVWAEAPRALLGTGHVCAGELIPTRLLSPIEIEQILESESIARVPQAH